MKDFQEEAGEEFGKVGWTCGPNESKTTTDTGGLCEDRFGSSEREEENVSKGWGIGDRWWIQQ